VNPASDPVVQNGEEFLRGGDDAAPFPAWRGVASRVLAAIRRGAEPNANFGNRLLTAGILLILACVFFVPSSFYVVPGFGSEDSWRLTINKALTECWGFGDRIIWTYGPFGFYETRCPYGIGWLCFVGFDLLVFLVLAWLAFDVLKQKFDAAVAWACVITLFTCKRLIHDQASAALYCVIICLIIRNLAKPGVIASAAIVVASILGLFVKVNFGLVSVFLCAVIFVIRASGREKSAILWLIVLAAQIGGAWAVASYLHTNLIAYVKSALDIVRQYNDGMALGPWPEWAPPGFGISHWMTFLFFWAFVVATMALFRKRGFSKETVLFMAVAGIATFVLYKTSVVRSDYQHNKSFLLGFPIIALAFLVHGPESPRPIWRWLFLATTAYACVLMFAEFGNLLIYLRREYLKSFFPINYAKEIKDYQSVRNWSSYTNYVLTKFPQREVPENIALYIGTKSVDVFPFEATLPLGRGMNFQPRPVPQTYVAMGKELESRNVAYLQSDRAPQFIFYVPGDKGFSPDGRYPLWEEPAVKRVIRERYKLSSYFNSLQGAQPEREPGLAPVLILERNSEASKHKEETLATKTERAGVEFTLPEENGELYARFKFKKTFLGRIVSFLYRGAPVDARFRLADGTEQPGRIIPSNLESGVLVNFFSETRDPERIKNYFLSHSQGNPRCVKLRIDYRHTWEYQTKFELTYFREVDASR
jgi:hypothetical protein